MADENDPLADLIKRRDDQRASTRMFAMSGIGFEFIVAVLFFGGIGYWLDGRYDWKPWGTIVGAAIGFTYGLTRLMRFATDTFKKTPPKP